MATLEQSNTFNSVRGNDKWEDLEAAEARALLIDAEDYIRNRWSIRTDLTEDEQRRFDNIVCRLAAIFQVDPPKGASSQTVKKEVKEGAGFKKEVEYNPADVEAYPYIATVIRPFVRFDATGIYWGTATA